MHEEIQLYYYWNVETGETSWEIPQVLVQADHLTNDPLPHASVNNKSNSATVGVDNSNMLSALTNVEKESDSKLKSCSTSLSPSMTYFFNSYKTDDEDTCSVVSIEAENDEERIMDGQGLRIIVDCAGYSTASSIYSDAMLSVRERVWTISNLKR
ncbi:hypothetical protein RYX36_010502 [Vicia faba]